MSKTTADQAKEALDTFNDLKKDIDKIKDSVDTAMNEASAATKKFEGATTAVKEMTQAIMLHEMSLRKLYMGYTAQSILSDALIRYMAGYEKGDYLKEMEKVAEKGGDVQLADMEIKNKDFDVRRLSDIAQEIADAQAKATEDAKKMRDLSESTIVAPDGKPVLRVVK
jgi:hypothetical protein